MNNKFTNETTRQHIMNTPVRLRGITWNHTRGFVPMVATAQRFHELHAHVEISWARRSLQEFADQSLTELAKQFDLLVIDHPWAGFAADQGVLLPLEKHLPVEFLDGMEANSVGRSHESYQFNGSQWALAIDAATPVSAYRPDRLQAAGADIPQTFDEVIALGKRGLVCCPSIPLDVYGNFLNLCKAAGETIFPNEQEVVRRAAGVLALVRLKQLADVVPPAFFELNPIKTLEVMSQTNEFAYCPYTYGYSNYSRTNYAAHVIRFGDVIGFHAGQPGSTMLGGTGLAISASCAQPQIAAQYAQFVADGATQGGIYFQSGGQPGHRSVWLEPSANAACTNYFCDTLPTLERAFVRPRYAGYLNFQDRAGEPIHDFLRHGGDAGNVLDKVNQLYRESRS
jgi:multiple sugar transport system substrate-binding protein